MIAAIMTYIIAVSLLLTLAGAAAERVAVALRLPRRGAWAATMVASFALPCAALLVANGRARSFGVIDAGASHAANAPNHPLPTLPGWPPSAGWPVWNELDAALILLWVLTSASMIALLVALSLRLHRKLRHWPVDRMNGDQVSITQDIGPAIFGALRPRILMPHWIVGAGADVREAALRHEQAHIAGRDPLLYACALVLVALAPWNLPLWQQLRRLRFAIEVDCDARVLRSGLDSATYGEALLAVASRKSSTPFAAMALVEQASHLERRIELMLLDKNRTYALAGLALVLLAAAPVAYALVLDPPVAPMSGKAAVAIAAAPVAAAPDRPVVKAADKAAPAGEAAPVAPAIDPPIVKPSDKAKAAGEAAPVAAALDPPVPNARGKAPPPIFFSADNIDERDKNRLVAFGDVLLETAADGLRVSADQITTQAEDRQLLQGNVRIDAAGGAQIITDRAVVTRRADGSASISADQAEVTIPPPLQGSPPR